MADQDSRTGAGYATRAILDYVDTTHVPHDVPLARAFAVPDGIPAIQVSPSDGKLLHLLLKLASAKNVVEIGTLVGYSAIQMARALPSGGHIWTIELDPQHAAVSRANIAAAGLAATIEVLVGAATEVLPILGARGPFDAVFIDADKENYGVYGQWALKHLRTGGLVLGDNAYLFGALLEDSDRGRSMRAFHALVAAACDSVCVPTPDGLVLGIKR